MFQFFKIILILEQSQKKAFRKDDILSSETTYDPISKQFKAKQHYTLGQNKIFCPKTSLKLKIKNYKNKKKNWDFEKKFDMFFQNKLRKKSY